MEHTSLRQTTEESNTFLLLLLKQWPSFGPYLIFKHSLFLALYASKYT